MRVTGGKLKGRSLFVPSGLDVRPTTDKVRQAIFNILSHETPGARALDLFAGTGSLGIEALSRGARSAVFVEKSSVSINCLKRNLEKLNLNSSVWQSDWRSALAKLRQAGETFDLIFADPPYGEISSETIAAEIVSTAEPALLASEGILIIESDKQEQPATSLTVLKQRDFGHTRVTFYASVPAVDHGQRSRP